MMKKEFVFHNFAEHLQKPVKNHCHRGWRIKGNLEACEACVVRMFQDVSRIRGRGVSIGAWISGFCASIRWGGPLEMNVFPSARAISRWNGKADIGRKATFTEAKRSRDGRHRVADCLNKAAWWAPSPGVSGLRDAGHYGSNHLIIISPRN